MAFDLITVLTRSRALRKAAEARCADPDNAEAEHDARVAFERLAVGMNMHVDAERPSRWSDFASLAGKLEAAAFALADARDGTFDQIGAVSTLTLHFGAVANRLGYEVEAMAPVTHDDAAAAFVEQRDAAE